MEFENGNLTTEIYRKPKKLVVSTEMIQYTLNRN